MLKSEEEVFYVGGVEAVDNCLLGLICRAVLGQKLDGGYHRKKWKYRDRSGLSADQGPVQYL